MWLGQRPLARIDNQTSIYTYHVDHLGTPQMMTDQSGTTVWRADYEPFGKASVRAGSTVENNLRLPGQYADRETGLHYNYYRSAYNPGTGRYEEADPIGLDGGLNIYAYVEGNPLSYTDPLGLKKGGLLGDLLKELLPETIETKIGRAKGKLCAKNLCKKTPTEQRILEQCVDMARTADNILAGGILTTCMEVCREELKTCPDKCEDK